MWVKVLNAAGSGTTSQIVCGIDWVTANARSGAGIEVANMSLGGQSPLGAFSTCSSSWGPMHQAICRSVSADVTYAVAAGNSAANANSFVPATYAEVITVSALPTSTPSRAVGAGQLPGRPGRHLRRLLQLRRRRGPDRPRGLHPVDLHGRRLRDPERDLDGHPARHRGGRAVPAQVKAALQQAGNLNWNDADDPDSTKERLLNVDAL